MTELAARLLHRRMVGGMPMRVAFQKLTWPVRKAVWKLEETIIWPLADVFRSKRHPDGFRVRRKWTRELRTRPSFSRPPRLSLKRPSLNLPRPALPRVRRRSSNADGAATIAVTAAGAATAKQPRTWGRDAGVALATVALAAGAGIGLVAIIGAPGADHGGTSAPDVPPPVPAGPLSSTQSPSAGDGHTLEGVTPQFNASSKPDTAPGAAADATAPAVSPLKGTNTKPSQIPPGGANEVTALHTARDFAGAFVLYEVGQSNKKVRKTFASTATPSLAKALRKRPPRLPSSGKVPKARVRNVILGTRHGRRITASVSLLRLGDLSELRLSLVHRRQGWAVDEVRG